MVRVICSHVRSTTKASRTSSPRTHVAMPSPTSTSPSKQKTKIYSYTRCSSLLCGSVPLWLISPQRHRDTEVIQARARYRAEGGSATFGLMRIVILLVIFAFPVISQAQNPSADVVMVLPFENTSNRAEYNWV